MKTLPFIHPFNGSARWLILIALVLFVAGCGPGQPLAPQPTDTPTPAPTATPIPGPQPGHYQSDETWDDHGNLVLIEFDIVSPGQLENFVGVVRSDFGTCRFEIDAIELNEEDGFDLDLDAFDVEDASGMAGQITGQLTEGAGFDGTLQITQCGRMFTMNWFNLEWESLLAPTAG